MSFIRLVEHSLLHDWLTQELAQVAPPLSPPNSFIEPINKLCLYYSKNISKVKIEKQSSK